MGRTLIVGAIAFGRHVVGIIVRPYETYRHIIDHGESAEFGYLALVLAGFFATAATVKTASFRPFLLTRQFLVLGSATGATFLLAVSLFWLFGRMFGGSGTFKGFSLGWAYTLMPTLVWFWMTSLLYVFFPPPRTQQPLGMAFSFVYLFVSAILLLWKVILSYLSLRFGLQLGLGKILGLSAVVLPILVGYSVGMYKLGIFRIPFI